MTALPLLARLRALDVRITVEGERLRLSAPPGVLTSELRAEIGTYKAEILRTVASAAAYGEPVASVPRDGRLPLTWGERRLWLLERIRPGRARCTVPFGLLLRGAVREDHLRQAVRALGMRHEILRTGYHDGEHGPRREISAGAELEMETADLRGDADSGRLLLASSAAREHLLHALRPFDLERPPLLRSLLLRLPGDLHALLFTAHHIVVDGWSIGLLYGDLAREYAAVQVGRTAPAEPPRLQYADFAVWQQRRLAEVLPRGLAYWRGALAGASPLLEIPFERPRPAARSVDGAFHAFPVGTFLIEEARAFARRLRSTPFAVFLAAFQVLLCRLGEAEDVAVGSAVAGRTRPETEPMVGMFVNALPLRGDLRGDPTLEEAARRCSEVVRAGHEHQEVPAELLVCDLVPERDFDRNPYFEAQFALQNYPAPHPEFPGIGVERLPVENPATWNDLSLYLAPSGEGFQGVVHYSTDLFGPDTAAAIASGFVAVLERMVRAPDRRVSELRLQGESRAEVPRAAARPGLGTRCASATSAGCG